MTDTGSDHGADLTRKQFLDMAERLGIDVDIRDELFPMARDLLAFAHQLNRLAPELGSEVRVDALSGGDDK